MTGHQNPNEEPYSGLEVVSPQTISDNGPEVVRGPKDQYSKLEHAPNPEAYSKLEHVLSPPAYERDNDKELPISVEHTDSDEKVSPTSSAQRGRRRKWIIGGIIAAVIILAVVLGATLGTILPRKKHTGAINNANFPPGSSTTSIFPMSGTATARSDYSYPTAVTLGYPHVEVFALTAAKGNSWKWTNSSNSTVEAWSPSNNTFQDIGGIAADWEYALTVTARGTDNVDIFGAGPANTQYGLYHKMHNLSFVWQPSPVNWEYLGGSISSPPTVVTWAETRLDVFALGLSDYQLYQLTWVDEDQGWRDWLRVDGSGSWEQYAPTVVTWGQNRLDVFLVGRNDSKLYHKYWDGQFWAPRNEFEDLGGYCAGRPVVVSRGSGILDIFVRGGDAGLWQLSYDNSSSGGTGWSNWTSISGTVKINAEPDAVAWGSDRMDVFAWGAEDGAMLHKSYSTTKKQWTPQDGFETLATGLTGPPKAVCDKQQLMHVFGYIKGQGMDQEMGYKVWNQDTGKWSPESGVTDLGMI